MKRKPMTIKVNIPDGKDSDYVAKSIDDALTDLGKEYAFEYSTCTQTYVYTTIKGTTVRYSEESEDPTLTYVGVEFRITL